MIISCRYCNTRFEWQSNGRGGRPPTFCVDHRDNIFRARVKRNSKGREGYLNYDPPQEVALPSYEQMRKNGITYEQRKWLRELLARVQRPKQHKAWKILGRD